MVNFKHAGHWALAIALLSPVQSLAQEAPADASQEDAGMDGEIIVTAQRTESLASKTPIALSAVTGDGLNNANVTNATGLGELIPNLNIVRTDGLRITIRGVSSADNTEKGDPSAAFLLDGIYLARPQAQEVSFFDIARVEVLRGPQGTLYGRNTTAGVVNLITNRPTDSFEAAVNIGYGNFDTRQADAMINLPVNESIALRFAGSYDRRDSYLIPNANEIYRLGPFKNNYSGRVQALFDLGPDASLLLRADYSSMRGYALNGQPSARFYNTTVPAGQPAYTDPLYIGGQFSSKERRALGFALQRDNEQHNSTWGVGGEFNWDFGPLALAYLGSYRELKRDEHGTSFIGRPYELPFVADYNQISQELRFVTTDTGPLSLQFGGYYFREKSSLNAFVLGVVPTFPYYGFSQDPTISEAYGIFGQATYSITPSLRLTAGARYSHDEKSRVGYTLFQQGPVFNPATDRRLQNSASASSSKVTWRVGLDYDLDDRSLIYGSVSTGYKAGGFNNGCSAGTVTGGVACNQPTPDNALYYNPETLTAYELGLKTRFADGAVRLNASAFYYDYKDLQLTSRIDINGVPTQFTTNAGKAKIKGVELEATVTPSERNRVDLSFSWLDGEYKEYFPRGVAALPDYRGRPLDYSPDITLSAGYTYTYPFESGASLAFGVRTRLSSSYVMTDFGTPRQLVQPSYTKTDLNLTYSAPDNRWYVQLFAKNLEDEVLVNSINISNGAVIATTGDPRTYGIRTGMKF